MQGVSDRDAAAKLTGLRLFVPRDALPAPEEDEFYLADLIGLRAVTAEGADLGRVVSVEDFGGGSFLTLRDAAGRDSEIPFTRACVPAVDLAGGTCTIIPPDEVVVEGRSAEDEGDDAA